MGRPCLELCVCSVSGAEHFGWLAPTALGPRRGLVVGRLLVGFGIGISAVVVPAYLGEVAPAGVRGRIVEVRALCSPCAARLHPACPLWCCSLRGYL